MPRPNPHTLVRLTTLTLLTLAATFWLASHLAPRLRLRDDYSTHALLALDHGQLFYITWGVGRAPWENPTADQLTTDISPTLPADVRALPATARGLGFRFFTGRLHNDVRYAPATLLVLPLWLPTTVATLLLLATWPNPRPQTQPVLTTFTPTRPHGRPPFTRPTPARPTTPAPAPTPAHT